jgi:EAL domain-containing protein (putative c-di-GMP-specific phosphodiesterase class I)
MDGRFRRIIPAGQQLFDVGDEGHEAYIIDQGLIDIVRVEGDALQRIARLGPNDMFGEMALLGDGRRSARAVAAEDSTIFVISRASFMQAVQSSDPLLRHLMRLNMQRARQFLLGTLHTQRETPATDASDRESAWERLLFEQDIGAALERGEFFLEYQPLMSLGEASPRVCSLEALIRWRRSGETLLPPSAFIPVAEASGQIVPIGHWILNSACEAAATLARAGKALTVAVNVSIRQLDDERLVPEIEAALARHALPPERLRLEITESLLIHHLEASKTLLARCRALGLSLAIDDFGTGYSSLAYLHHLPVDTLKLDRSFIADVLHNDASRKIVRAVARMARDLGMQTVAEGVETAEQVAAMTELGIDTAQGFYFHRPMGLAAVLQLVAPAKDA